VKRTTKRTYALPSAAIDAFEKSVPAGERSSVVAALIQNWLDERERKAIRDSVIEGCREMAEISLELERDFHPLEGEVHRAIECDSDD
jgi:hypothetical protein